jgi:hypothetical protein
VAGAGFAAPVHCSGWFGDSLAATESRGHPRVTVFADPMSHVGEQLPLEQAKQSDSFLDFRPTVAHVYLFAPATHPNKIFGARLIWVEQQLRRSLLL